MHSVSILLPRNILASLLSHHQKCHCWAAQSQASQLPRSVAATWVSLGEGAFLPLPLMKVMCHEMGLLESTPAILPEET